MNKSNLTNKAVRDLEKIWNYTYDRWSENQADKYYQLLLDSCQEVANNQNLGKEYYTIHPDLKGFYTGRHIIFYIIINANLIEVVRILHGRMDLKKRIKE